MHSHLTLSLWRIAASAQEQASAAGQTQVQPEHLLAALLNEPGGIAPRLFAELGAVPTDLSATLAANVALRPALPAAIATTSEAPEDAPGIFSYTYPIVLSPRSKRAVDYSHEEAALLGHDRAGVEHLLLGLIREGEGEGESGRTLAGHCITLDRARRAVAHAKAAYRPALADPAVVRIVTYTYDLTGRVTHVTG